MKATIQRFNKCHATRLGELCGGRGRVLGTGRYKCWTPEAVLRACFGLSGPKQRKTVRRRWQLGRKMEGAAGPRQRSSLCATALATRAYASFSGSSHLYVQHVRDAVSEFIVQSVLACALERRREADAHAYWEIVTLMVDETDFLMHVGGDRGTQHILMLAGSLFHRTPGHPEWREEVVIPPAAVEDTNSANIAKALAVRGGWLFDNSRPEAATSSTTAPKRRLQCIIFFSDSAASLIKIGCHYVKHRPPLTMVWSGRCFMHKLWASIVYATKPLDFVNQMCCATCIMHKGSFASKVKSLVFEFIRARIKLVYDQPTEEDVQRNTALVGILEGYDSEFDMGAAATPGERQKWLTSAVGSREWLVKHCPGQWSDRAHVFYYVAPHDTCENATQAAEAVFAHLMAAFLRTRPPIPALNRWNRVFAPLTWWTFALQWHGIVAEAVVRCASAESTDLQSRLDPGHTSIDPVGPSTEEGEREKRLSRLAKLRTWLDAPLTQPRTILAVLVIRSALAMMMTFFGTARMGRRSNLLAFCWSTTSPAVLTIDGIVDKHLSDPESATWKPFLGHDGAWRPEALHSASLSLLRFIGNLYLRLVEPFEEWPYALGRLLHPDVPEETKEYVASCFLGNI